MSLGFFGVKTENVLYNDLRYQIVHKYLWFVIGLGVALDYCQSHGT